MLLSILWWIVKISAFAVAAIGILWIAIAAITVMVKTLIAVIKEIIG